jgi:hypothetical protein
MSDQSDNTPPVERVERIEVIERSPGGVESRRAAPMWAWLLPLVIVVVALVWYILTRGEPTSPAEVITSLRDVV